MVSPAAFLSWTVGRGDDGIDVARAPEQSIMNHLQATPALAIDVFCVLLLILMDVWEPKEAVPVPVEA